MVFCEADAIIPLTFQGLQTGIRTTESGKIAGNGEENGGTFIENSSSRTRYHCRNEQFGDTSKNFCNNFHKFSSNEFRYQAPEKRDTSEIWLKHPGNESSEDEEGTEEVRTGDDEMEETDFKSFVDKRHEAQIEKAKNNRK